MINLIKRTSKQSSANSAVELSTIGNSKRELLMVLVAFSAAPTYTGSGLTVKVDSGLGASYDVVLSEGTTNGQYKAYIPDGKPIIFEDDEVIVNVPAGGSGITSTITIVTKEIGF